MIHSCSMIFFFIFFYCRSMYFIWTILWLWGQEEHKRDTGHTGLFLYWAVFGCSCCIRDWTALLVPFFGLFQIALINFCTACTQTAFVIQKLKALGDFQIIFNIIFASFVPDLIRAKSMYVYDAKLKNYRYVVLLVNVAAGHNRGPAQACGSV